MALSDCEQCWETPCICGFEYQSWTTERRLKLVRAALPKGYRVVVAEDALKVGDVLVGFCNGKFGRDSHNDKKVEGIGPGWVVVRDENDLVQVYQGNPNNLVQYKAPSPDPHT